MELWKEAMAKFTEKIVNMMKAEKLFQPQGGHIILTQFGNDFLLSIFFGSILTIFPNQFFQLLCQTENEYQLVEFHLEDPGKAYTKWSAKMAVGLNTQVPWVMRKQGDAPHSLVRSSS